MVIATGRYLSFAHDLLGDLRARVAPERSLVVNLFTDGSADDVRELEATHPPALNVIPVPALRWPEASLHRYELFHNAAGRIDGDALVYLDADMRVAEDFSHLVRPDDWPGRMAAVRHPGYYRPRQVRPRGTWETRHASTAYVPLWRRRRYVCGGVWMGAREEFLRVSAELAGRVQADAANGVTARWHDESHWNWWVANHRVHVFDPSLCFVPDYPWLSGLRPVIVAVDKGTAFEREATSHPAVPPETDE
jgi:hypothetical protein